MKRVVFFAILVFFITTAPVHADWYVIDKETNRAIAKTQYKPDEEDLDNRGEFAVQTDKNIPIGIAEYFDGKIRERAKSQEEKNREQKNLEKRQDLKAIQNRIYKNACQELKTEGRQFKQINCNDFDIPGGGQ